MKRIATAALAVCLLSGTPALADADHNGGANNGGHNEGGHNEGGQNNGGHNNGAQPHGNPQVHGFQGGPQNSNGPQGFGRHFQGGQGGPPNNNGPQVFERRFQGGPPNDNGPQVLERHFRGGPPNDNNPQVFEHQNRGAPGFQPGGERPRYNPQFFPRVFHPHERFEWREGHWRHPQGWFYRTWFYGEILPFGWFDQDFWISDYWSYDLPVPPYGYEWVRNGPDALLVDIRSGFVVEVVPEIFY